MAGRGPGLLASTVRALIFGDPSTKPWVGPQTYGVLIYFYAHKIAGWAIGSFLVAGLAGLTQRN